MTEDKARRGWRGLSLSTRILIGLGLGILTGVFLGEFAQPLQVLSDAYIRLMQMTVIPYMAVAIIVGLGQLTLVQEQRPENTSTLIQASRITEALGDLGSFLEGLSGARPLPNPKIAKTGHEEHPGEGRRVPQAPGSGTGSLAIRLGERAQRNHPGRDADVSVDPRQLRAGPGCLRVI